MNLSKKSMHLWTKAAARRSLAAALSLFVLTTCALLPASAHAAATFNTTLTMPGNSLGMVGHSTFDGKDMISNVRDSSGQESII